ncbi:MAG: hypothetical protein RJA99_3831 [Pseudomonadota bacterium]|jgi:soluble lytic murein transglycosylase-like protein
MFDRIFHTQEAATDGRPRRSRRTAAGLAAAAWIAGCAQWPGLPAGAGAAADCAASGARIDVVALDRARARQPLALDGCEPGEVVPGAPTAVSPAVPVIRIDRIAPPAPPSTPAAPPAPKAGASRAAAATPAPSPGPLTEPMRRLDRRVNEVARRNDLDPLLLHALIHVESRHRTDAVSPAGARGAMQLMPATAERYGVADPRRLHDEAFNLAAGAAHLKVLSGEFGDDLELVLAAYNAGEGAVRRHGGRVPPFPETRAYVRDVLAEYRRLQAGVAAATARPVALAEDVR